MNTVIFLVLALTLVKVGKLAKRSNLLLQGGFRKMFDEIIETANRIQDHPFSDQAKSVFMWGFIIIDLSYLIAVTVLTFKFLF